MLIIFSHYFKILFPWLIDGMIISHMPHGPTAYFTLFDTVMRHDIPNVGTMSEEYPLVMAHGINSDLGKRVCVPFYITLEVIANICIVSTARQDVCVHVSKYSVWNF